MSLTQRYVVSACRFTVDRALPVGAPPRQAGSREKLTGRKWHKDRPAKFASASWPNAKASSRRLCKDLLLGKALGVDRQEGGFTEGRGRLS